MTRPIIGYNIDETWKDSLMKS